MSDETHDTARKLPVAQHAGARIHMVMWERRIRQSDLADRVGMSQSTLSKKLRGEVPITVDELVALAHALGIHATDLLPLEAEGDDGGEVPAGPHRRHPIMGTAS